MRALLFALGFALGASVGVAGAQPVGMPPTAAATAPSTIWNPSDKTSNIGLSGGNLTATFNTGSSYGGVRGNTSYTSGKYYFEITTSQFNASGYDIIGIANASWIEGSTGLGFDTNSAGVQIRTSFGTCIYNYNSSGNMFICSPTTGNTIGVAVDIGSQLYWYRSTTAENWNGSPTANPATGTGGYSFAISGAIFPAWGVFTGVPSTGDNATVNFCSVSCSGTAPTGFGKW